MHLHKLEDFLQRKSYRVTSSTLNMLTTVCRLDTNMGELMVSTDIKHFVLTFYHLEILLIRVDGVSIVKTCKL